MELPSDSNNANKSRTSSAYASTAVRPRAKRFITGLEEFSESFPPQEPPTATALASASPAPSAVNNSPFFTSRAPSPIPKQHPSRASSLRPPTTRQASIRPDNNHTGNGELGPALSGLFGKSWTSLQELASNYLGNDGSDEAVKDNPNWAKRGTPSTSRPPSSRSQWGPSFREQNQPGAGSQQERSALVRAKKREEMLASGANGYAGNAASTFKRRTSDDFNSMSAPPGENDDRDILVYVHHVSPRDTLAGISIKYNCQLMAIKKTNRLWSNDGIQARKTLIIPVDACSIRGRRVAPSGSDPTEYLTGNDGSTNDDSDFRRRPSSTVTITQANASNHPKGQLTASPPASPPESITTNENPDPWTHDHWILLEGQTHPTEIARLPRSNLGYFPRAKRKSGSISSLERSSTSLDFPQRPSITVSDTSSGKSSFHRHRRSSGSNQFASQMLGPGGVGSLKGRGPSTPGPAEDKFTKALKKATPSSIRLPGQSPPGLGSASNHPSEDELYLHGYASASQSQVSTPGFGDFGNAAHAVEGWAKKLGKGLVNAFDSPSHSPAPPGSRDGADRQRRKHMAPRKERGGYSSTTGGDLIELAQAFEIGEDGEEEEEEDLRTPRGREEGRRGSLDHFRGGRLRVPGQSGGVSRSRSQENLKEQRKGD